jgi:hypothetical protein
MAQTIQLTSPEQRELFGLDGTVTERSQQLKKVQKQSRWGRRDAEQMILKACAYRELTRLEIAKALDRAKTPHLIALIESMVKEGYLSVRTDTMPNSVIVYKYIAR